MMTRQNSEDGSRDVSQNWITWWTPPCWTRCTARHLFPYLLQLNLPAIICLLQQHCVDFSLIWILLHVHREEKQQMLVI